MSNIIDSIRLSGTTYQIQGEITVDAALDSGSTNPVANSAITTALDGKQDTLVSGTNIKTINNQSILGSGNINIQGGGGKAIEAGRGISITTGETADTVSFNLPISAGTGTNSIAEGYNTTASGDYGSHAEGDHTVASGDSSHAEGNRTTANGHYSHAEGRYTEANNNYEHASGRYNISNKANDSWGDSGNTLFSVGNGTTSSSRHNAFEVRQNGDIYISSGNTDIKLQDHLGGGSVTVDTALDSGSTNPVQNKVIYDKFDEVEEVTAAGLNALNDKITPTVELTQAEYDALTTKDPNTYYIITDAQAGDLTNYYTKTETNTLLGGKADTATTYTKTEVDTALAGKQTTLTAGTGIDITDNVISTTGGVNVVQTTGTSTTDVMSQDAATSNFIYKINLKYKVNGRDTLALQSKGKNLFIPYMTINGEKVLSTNDLSVIETSAITTSVTSSSTDAQVPSAKAVYNAIQEGGGGGTVDQTIISGSTNAVAGGAVYDKIDEVEQVTAAGLNAVNDALGGLKLVKLTQAEYNALATKDSSTLYIIVN